MKKRKSISTVVVMLVVGCSNENQMLKQSAANKHLQTEHAKSKAEILHLQAKFDEIYKSNAVLKTEFKESEAENSKKLTAAINNANAWKHVFDESARSNAVLKSKLKDSETEIENNLAAAVKNANAWKHVFDESVENNKVLKGEMRRLKGEGAHAASAKHIKELASEDVVGTYQYNVEDGKTNRAIFMNNGVVQHYGWDKQKARLKWEIRGEEVLITGNFGTFFCRKETDGKLTKIAEVKDRVRIELPVKEQISGNKIK